MRYEFARGATPYPTPGVGARLRIAFVGQSTFFEACALRDELRAVESRFIEFRAGADANALTAELHAARPHVVVVFRPEIIPAGAFHGLAAATVGFITEPLPRTVVGAVRHEDLERRLDELREVDASNFDRVVSFDPLVAQTADAVLPVWRSLPLPVSDRYFRAVEPIKGKPRVLFVGRSTAHRERMLTPTKHEHDLLHLAFGVGADALADALAQHDVGINVHNHPYPSFENRVGLHLASGHLVLTETLSPNHGLETNIDYIQVDTPGEIMVTLDRLGRFPRMYHRVRIRGRMKAEQFRASRVYPRLVSDLFSDLQAFGTQRALAAAA